MTENTENTEKTGKTGKPEKNEKRNRWMINLVLALASAGLLLVSTIPLFTMSFNRTAEQAASPSPTQSNAPKKEELESQAKGYELVLQREPENQTALQGLLQARLELIQMGAGEVKSVISPLEKLAKLNPGETRYTVLLAQARQGTGDREGAAQAYRSILSAKPGDLDALQGLVKLLVDQQRPEQAIALLQDTVKAAPQANQVQAGSVDVTAVQVLLGKVYASQKRFDEAVNVFDEAIKTNKQDFQPVLYKALVLKEQGKTEEAKPLFTTAASLAPPQFKDQINQLANAPLPGSTPAAPTPTGGSVPAQPSIAPSAAPSPTPTTGTGSN